jgi:hypothetical protein
MTFLKSIFIQLSRKMIRNILDKTQHYCLVLPENCFIDQFTELITYQCSKSRIRWLSFFCSTLFG